MTISEFIDLIEAHDFMSPNQIAALRRQHGMGNLDMSIDELAYFLLERNRLTKYQAKKLITESKSGEKRTAAPVSEARKRAMENWQQAAPVADEIATPENGDVVPLDSRAHSVFSSGELDSVESLSAEAGEDPFAENPTDQPAKAYKKKTSPANPWDSPLLYIGGGSLVVLTLIGVLLYYFLPFDTGEKIYSRGAENYQKAAFAKAATDFSRLLSRFPDHPSAPSAEVLLGMCDIQQRLGDVTESTAPATLDLTLQTVGETLSRIESSPDFDLARPDLAILLPEMAGDIASQAQKTGDLEKKRELVVLADDAMQLVNNPAYLPTSSRQTQRTAIDQAEQDVFQAKRDIEKGDALQGILGTIDEYTERGEFLLAYKEHRRVVDQYPALRYNNSLKKALNKAAKSLLSKVAPIADLPDTITDESVSEFKQIVFSDRIHAVQGNQSGTPIAIRIHGSIYAFDSGTGNVIWRRYVGLMPNSIPFSFEENGGYFLVVDKREHGLLALRKEDGHLLWRVNFESPIFRPAISDDLLIVTEQSGRAWKLNRITGEVLAGVQFPQEIAASAGLVQGISAVYVVADHSNMFTLDLESFECVEVVPINHETGQIAVAPVGTQRHLFLEERLGNDSTVLHNVMVDAQGRNSSVIDDRIRIPGHIFESPVINDSQVIMANDRGELFVFRVDPSSKDLPVSLIANTKSRESESMVSHLAFHRRKLWVFDRRMTAYQIRLATGSLSRLSSAYDQEYFVAPPVFVDDRLIHARQQKGKSGFVITAQRLDSQLSDSLWMTAVGTSMVGPLFKENEQSVVATRRGTIFEVPRGNKKQQIQTEAISRISDPIRAYDFDFSEAMKNVGQVFYTNATSTVQGMIWNGKKATLVEWDPDCTAPDQLDPLQKTEWAAGFGAPSVWSSYMVIPTRCNSIVAVDPKSGEQPIYPFQPDVTTGQQIRWSRPLVLHDGSKLLVTDRDRSIYCLEKSGNEDAALSVVEKVTVTDPLVSDLAFAGLMLVAGCRDTNDGREYLQVFQLPELSRQDPLPVAGSILSQPVGIGNRIFVVTSEEGLIAVRDDFQLEPWNIPLNGKTLISGPIAAGDRIAIGLSGGEIWLIDPHGGTMVQQYSIQEPLSENLSYVEGKLFAHGYDGTLHLIPLTTDGEVK